MTVITLRSKCIYDSYSNSSPLHCIRYLFLHLHPATVHS